MLQFCHFLLTMVVHYPEDLLPGEFIRNQAALLATDYQLINDDV